MNDCLSIQTLAGLLQYSQPGLQPETAARAGAMIFMEAEKLQAQLKALATAAEK